jgi:hypothetical protein
MNAAVSTEPAQEVACFATQMSGTIAHSAVTHAGADLTADKTVTSTTITKKKTKTKSASKQVGKEKNVAVTVSAPQSLPTHIVPFHQSQTGTKDKEGDIFDSANAYARRENEFPGISCEAEQIPLEMDAYDGSNCGMLIPSLTNEYSFM